MQKNNFHVITGGPGVGKTTLIERLRDDGIQCVDEVARRIIKNQVTTGGNALPWEDQTAYTRLMLAHSIESFEVNADRTDVIFFDRGIPDTLAYAELIQLPDTFAIEQAVQACRYNPDVFILPPWEEIYCGDAERKQSFNEAVATYERMKQVYQKMGYHLIDVPHGTITERLNFIKNTL